MSDDLLKRIVDDALTHGTETLTVDFTAGELMLYQALLQTSGLDLAGAERLIPLMERNKARIDQIGGAAG